jgi:hypothetical protein
VTKNVRAADKLEVSDLKSFVKSVEVCTMYHNLFHIFIRVCITADNVLQKIILTKVPTFQNYILPKDGAI